MDGREVSIKMRIRRGSNGYDRTRIVRTCFVVLAVMCLNRKVSFAMGDAQFTFDWKRGGRLVNAPASGQVNYIHMFGKQPVRFFVNAQYNFINDIGARKWTLSPGFALILR